MWDFTPDLINNNGKSVFACFMWWSLGQILTVCVWVCVWRGVSHDAWVSTPYTERKGGLERWEDSSHTVLSLSLSPLIPVGSNMRLRPTVHRQRCCFMSSEIIRSLVSCRESGESGSLRVQWSEVRSRDGFQLALSSTCQEVRGGKPPEQDRTPAVLLDRVSVWPDLPNTIIS